ncbi:hypothetical protein [Planktothrix agardhii]|uniref:hypothetical protein n=1 Tax=Planktothrix agardhii TaxID=1160 RepID=UPI00041C4549|nr:hypothetical protein [Planktothrix agardhii]MCF3609110.1 hypothetical protein [Planktothrix agardhii 1033]CAD5982526.1 hypothetical protein NO758_04907 [Planktothrix agardhii]
MTKLNKFKAFSLSTLVYGIAALTFLPIPKAEAATNFNCPGQFPQNRMQFSVSYLDGRFTTITLTPQSGPPRTNQLRYDRPNERGELVYRGGDMGGADIIVIDLSKGAVQPGTQVSVSLDGQWARGTCRL